jgi:hypothetical protein
MIYKIKQGSINWHWMHSDEDYIEYLQRKHPLYTLASKWCLLDRIEASQFGIGYGSYLLDSWIKTLPINSGILANPVSLYFNKGLNQTDLVAWYMRHSFKSIPKAGPTLYRIEAL